MLLSFLVGFWSLAGQFVYNRIIFFYVANSDYAAASIISMHLAGFLIGSLIARRGKLPVFPVIGLSLMLTGLAQLLVWSWGVVSFGLDETLLLTLGFAFLLALTSGFIVVRLMEQSKGERGATTIIIADSMGSVMGAVVGGFYLVPVLGIQTSFGIVAALQALALVVVFTKVPGVSARMRGLAALMLVAGLGLIVAAGPETQHEDAEIMRVDGFPLPDLQGEGVRIAFERRTPYGVLSVLDNGEWLSLYSDNRFLCAVGRKEDLGVKSQWLLGSTVSATTLEDQDELAGPRVAIVGLGCGTTLAAILANFPRDGRGAIDVIDINPAIEEAQEKFKALLPGGMDDPRTSLTIEEGFVFFAEAVSAEKLYDAVVIDVAWMQNMNSTHIFSKEMFENVKKSMKVEGMLALWSEENNPVSPITLTIYRTLAAVFKKVIVRSTDDGTLFFASDIYNKAMKEAEKEESRLQFWVKENAEDLPVNELDNLVLNRYRFTLLGDHVGTNMRGRYADLVGQ